MIQAVRGEVRGACVHLHNSQGSRHSPVPASVPRGMHRDRARRQPSPHLGSESGTCCLLALSSLAGVTSPLPSTKTAPIAPDMTGDEIKAAVLSQRTWQEAYAAWDELVNTVPSIRALSRAGRWAPACPQDTGSHLPPAPKGPVNRPRSHHVHFRTRDSSGLWGVPTLGPLQAGHR